MTDLPARASVIVIGGGVVGAATARHLGKLGCSDAILLEQSKIGSGTTWHAAGNMETWRADPLIGEMVAYAVRLFPELEQESGISFGWRQTGRIHFTADRHLMDAYRAVPGRARARGVDVQCISPGEIAEKLPIISPEGLLGGLWTPNDGRVDPTNLAMAHARSAAQQGVKVFEEVPVTGIHADNGRVVAVKTEQGEIRCDAVVLAAGLWSTTLARSCGIRLPLMALHHFYFLTKPIDGLSRDLPLFLSYDERIYGREDVGGLLMGVFDEDAIPLEPEELPGRFSFSLLPENWDQVQPNMPVVLNRFPLLDQAEIRMLVNGPESFTPDGEMLLGEHPELRGLHLATGMNSNGIALSSAAGLVTAERLVHGRPTLDTTRLHVDRFVPFQSGNRYRRARMSEIPTWFCKAHGPGGDFVGTRNIRRSPFHHRHVAHGAVFRTIAGLERPAWFEASAAGGTVTDHVAAEMAATDTAAWSDRSGDTLFWLEGIDAAALLNRLTGAAGVTTAGKVTIAPFLNEDGGIEAMPTVLALSTDRYLLMVPPDQGIGLRSWIRQQGDGFRTGLVDVTAGFAVIDLFGAAVPAMLSELAGAPIDLEAGHVVDVSLVYAPAHVVRLPYEGPWQALVPADFAAALIEAMAGFVPVGSIAADALRVERGEPVWGREVTGWVGPHACGLKGRIDPDRSGYIGELPYSSGRAPVMNRVCRTFVSASASRGPANLEPILQDGRTVGHVTSSMPIPRHGQLHVMASVDLDADKELHVLVDGMPVPLRTS